MLLVEDPDALADNADMLTLSPVLAGRREISRANPTFPLGLVLAREDGEADELVVVDVARGGIETLAQLGLTKDITVSRFFVKAPVFSVREVPGVDPKLSPEMKSTGEVMGVSRDLGEAFYKAMLGAGTRLPRAGTLLVTVADREIPPR